MKSQNLTPRSSSMTTRTTFLRVSEAGRNNRVRLPRSALRKRHQPTQACPLPKRELPGVKRGSRRRSKPAVISPLNDKEADYIETFLVDNVDVGFGRAGKQVPIDVEYHSLITILRALHGNNVTIGGIINNMLKEHFDLHEAEITGLLNKNTKLNNR